MEVDRRLLLSRIYSPILHHLMFWLFKMPLDRLSKVPLKGINYVGINFVWKNELRYFCQSLFRIRPKSTLRKGNLYKFGALELEVSPLIFRIMSAVSILHVIQLNKCAFVPQGGLYRFCCFFLFITHSSST